MAPAHRIFCIALELQNRVKFLWKLNKTNVCWFYLFMAMQSKHIMTLVFSILSLVQIGKAQKVEVIKAQQLYQMIEVCEKEACVYNFWATWCAPCIKEIPEFDKLAMASNEVRVRLISLDDVDDLTVKVKRFIEKRNLKAEVMLLDETDFNEWIPRVDEQWSGAIPATLVVTKSGDRHFFEKEFKEGELEETLRKLDILLTN